MEKTNPIYQVTLLGQKFNLEFVTEDSPTKMGINMRFVMEDEPQDIRDKQKLSDKVGVILQKRFGDAGIAVTFNDRNPYKNVISFIVPIDSISKILMNALKG